MLHTHDVILLRSKSKPTPEWTLATVTDYSKLALGFLADYQASTCKIRIWYPCDGHIGHLPSTKEATAIARKYAVKYKL